MAFAIADCIAAQRRNLAHRLDRNDPAERDVMVQHACIETGGTLVPAGMNGGSFAELDLLGITEYGETDEEVIANWIKSAKRCAPIPMQAEG